MHESRPDDRRQVCSTTSQDCKPKSMQCHDSRHHLSSYSFDSFESSMSFSTSSMDTSYTGSEAGWHHPENMFQRRSTPFTRDHIAPQRRTAPHCVASQSGSSARVTAHSAALQLHTCCRDLRAALPCFKASNSRFCLCAVSMLVSTCKRRLPFRHGPER